MLDFNNTEIAFSAKSQSELKMLIGCSTQSNIRGW